MVMVLEDRLPVKLVGMTVMAMQVLLKMGLMKTVTVPRM